MQIENRPEVDFSALKRAASEMTLQDFARGLIGPIATFPGNISLAKGCTWQTIWDAGGAWGGSREYRINNTGSSGQIEIEVDGAVIDTLDPYQSRDISGRKIRVHAPQPQPGSSSGTFERL